MKGKVIVVNGVLDGIGYVVVEVMVEVGGDVVLWYNMWVKLLFFICIFKWVWVNCGGLYRNDVVV